jgi:hypothetical protein
MVERDWDRDFDLAAWRALSTAQRSAWIEQAWRRENEREEQSGAPPELPITRRQRYERGQTAWDIGLDPQPFDIALAQAVGEVKPELAHGVVFGCPDVRDRVLSALLANAGLRRAVRLAPLALWRQALSPERERVPVVRPEFVAEPTQHGVPTYWLRHRLAQPFYAAYLRGAGRQADTPDVLPIGYLQIGDHSLAKPDLIVLRDRWAGKGWPTPADALLVVEISATTGDLLYDWQIRRPAYLAAGAEEVWVIDGPGWRVFRQARGQPPSAVHVRPGDPEQLVTFEPSSGWPSNGSDAPTAPPAVAVHLADLFGRTEHVAPDLEDPTAGDFDAWQQRERARLEQGQTPWTMGHTPQWFDTTIVEVSGRFKDELWQGVLFGPEHRRDEILSALLANVGLGDARQFAPRELWQAAVDQVAEQA